MATTSELLVVLQEQCKGWNVNGPRGLLWYLNQAHKMLLQKEAETRVYFDETTGKLPFLDTTDGVYNYSLPSNCWKLADVLVEIGVTGSILDNYTGADYGIRTASKRRIERVTFAGIDYLKIFQVRSWPASETAVARMAFADNPGTTDDVYNIKYYKKPTDITSDSIQIEIEPPFDVLYLLPATVKLIESQQHGNYLEARKELLATIIPMYWKEMNSGAQGFDNEAEDRGF